MDAFARAPGGANTGAATQAMPERRGSRAKLETHPSPAHRDRPAGFVARSLHIVAGMLVARVAPAGSALRDGKVLTLISSQTLRFRESPLPSSSRGRPPSLCTDA